MTYNASPTSSSWTMVNADQNSSVAAVTFFLSMCVPASSAGAAILSDRGDERTRVSYGGLISSCLFLAKHNVLGFSRGAVRVTHVRSASN